LRATTGDMPGAVDDLEEAFGLRPDVTAEDLITALDRNREHASGDEERRASTTRLVAVLRRTGDTVRARELLAEWTASHPQDRDALISLRDIDEAAGHWVELVPTCERLVALETGEDQVEAVLRLAEACDKAEQPDASRVALEAVLEAQPQ